MDKEYLLKERFLRKINIVVINKSLIIDKNRKKYIN